MPSRSTVLLHASCHNPTGVDLDASQWQEVAKVMKARDLLPFVDFAYQGFGSGISEDAIAISALASEGLRFLVASSFSKSFSLYRERVGSLNIVTGDADEHKRVTSQLKRVIRTNYSNPSSHGGQVVAMVLSDPKLRQAWEDELREMRERIFSMRTRFVEGLAAQGVKRDFSFITQQRGMFSYSGLELDRVKRLRSEFGLYIVDSGRICVAALNDKNLEYVTSSIAKVL
jgi:aromatic-amino-acid transaminase